jgi:hypothetical protein
MNESFPCVDRIGVVLVHGVGEQKRFDHLTAEVKHLVTALEALPGSRVSVDTSATQDSAVGAAYESWRADEVAPIRIYVEQGPAAKKFCLCLHEVWWADLDDKETLWNRLKFWFWGLGFWLVRKYTKPVLAGAIHDMQPPEFPPFRMGGERFREALARARLWFFAIAFLLSATTLNVLNYALRKLRLGQLPGGDVFYQFVGDVKLYQDRARPGKGPLTNPDDPRRVAIRRRLLRVFVDVYRAKYDRWYVLAHSLGTVVAWNGLMETAHALPNYLSEATRAALADDPVLGNLQKSRPVDDMMPARPVWIDDDQEAIDRKKLFEGLRGFVTYGSPLDKFAYLWPQIVNLNKDGAVWSPGFEWINVFEHTDPVSSPLMAFSRQTSPAGSPAPRNMAYKASPWLLLSHLKYLELRTESGKVPDDLFVLRLAHWILKGNEEFPEPGVSDKHWYRTINPAFGLLLRLPAWTLGTLALVLVIAYVGVPALLAILTWLAGLELLEIFGMAAFFSNLSETFADFSFLERTIGILIAAAAVVTVAGIVTWVRGGPPSGERSDSFGPVERDAAAPLSGT